MEPLQNTCAYLSSVKKNHVFFSKENEFKQHWKNTINKQTYCAPRLS